MVVAYHAALFGFKLPGRVDRFGWIGVDLFFVLSGYLIGGQLLAPLARDRPINLGRFFTRRALRIMPAYFVVLAIYFLLPSWREYSEMSQPLWKFLLSVQKHRAPRRHSVLARMVARDRRPILSRLAVDSDLDQLLAARGDHHSLHNLYRRTRLARGSRMEKSVDRRRRVVPRFPSMDLLSNLDPARSARVWRCAGVNRKISSAMVEATH